MFQIFFDGAAVPAIVTEDANYRPARDSLPWLMVRVDGTRLSVIDSYDPARKGWGKIIPFPQYGACAPILLAA